jgi:hypothetical protein
VRRPPWVVCANRLGFNLVWLTLVYPSFQRLSIPLPWAPDNGASAWWMGRHFHDTGVSLRAGSGHFRWPRRSAEFRSFSVGRFGREDCRRCQGAGQPRGAGHTVCRCAGAFDARIRACCRSAEGCSCARAGAPAEVETVRTDFSDGKRKIKASESKAPPHCFSRQSSRSTPTVPRAPTLRTTIPRHSTWSRTRPPAQKIHPGEEEERQGRKGPASRVLCI